MRMAVRALLIGPLLLGTVLGYLMSEYLAQVAPQRAIYVAYVTGYNTVPAQTDNTPCIGASGINICGRRDAIACPRRIKLGTVVMISDKRYVCEDRTAPKFDGRFDISCDKDKRCPYKVAGWKIVRVIAK